MGAKWPLASNTSSSASGSPWYFDDAWDQVLQAMKQHLEAEVG